MKKSFDSLKHTIENMNSIISEKMIKSSTNSVESAAYSDNLKTEVQSLKNLLLNRSQFPSVPTVTPVVLPSWQLKEQSKSLVDDVKHNNIDNKNNDEQNEKLIET
jgi:hypothetical protein